MFEQTFKNIYLRKYETMPNRIHGKNKNAEIPETPGINENPVGADSISAQNTAKTDNIAEMDPMAKTDYTAKTIFTIAIDDMAKGQKWILPLQQRQWKFQRNQEQNRKYLFGKIDNGKMVLNGTLTEKRMNL